MKSRITPSIRKYCVPQRYESYTRDDHWVWARMMKKLSDFREKHRSRIYAPYLRAIETLNFSRTRIPRIEEINAILAPAGWRAVCVDGYLPPHIYAAMQENRILGIARNLRGKEHLAYAPSPDMIHDVFGHLPLLLDEDYRALLDHSTTTKALARPSLNDDRLYRANLSLARHKERDGGGTDADQRDIRRAQVRVRERPSLFRMLHHLSFWSLEFGVLGSPGRFVLFGAGLLSSISESERVLRGQTPVLRFNRAAAKYDFNISDFQDQIFSAPSIDHYWKTINRLIREYAS